MKRRPSRTTIILGVLLVLVVAVGAGLFVYDQLFGLTGPDDTPPEAPTLQAAAESQQVVYRIDPEQSEVRYNTNEIFLRENRSGSPVGVTQGIAGDVLIDFANPANSQVGTIVINIEQFKSDSGLRDGRIRKEFLESSEYPEATFVTTELINFPENPVEGQEYQFQIVGDLTVKETTAPTTWEVTAALEGDTLRGSAKTQILMSTYDVGPISLAGILETEDEVRLEFDFVAVRVVQAEVSEEAGS
jgi:polyisoprenoid-binding protein YceI